MSPRRAQRCGSRSSPLDGCAKGSRPASRSRRTWSRSSLDATANGACFGTGRSGERRYRARRDLRHPPQSPGQRSRRAQRRQPAEGPARQLARAPPARAAAARADPGRRRGDARRDLRDHARTSLEQGTAVLWVTTDFDELAAVCRADRRLRRRRVDLRARASASPATGSRRRSTPAAAARRRGEPPRVS